LALAGVAPERQRRMAPVLSALSPHLGGSIRRARGRQERNRHRDPPIAPRRSRQRRCHRVLDFAVAGDS
jgi:hypothetical protein